VPGHFAQTGPVLGHLARAGLYLCILLPPYLFSGIFDRPYLCPRTIGGPDVSVLLHLPERCSGIFRNLCRGILNGPYGPDLLPAASFSRPAWNSLNRDSDDGSLFSV